MNMPLSFLAGIQAGTNAGVHPSDNAACCAAVPCRSGFGRDWFFRSSGCTIANEFAPARNSCLPTPVGAASAAIGFRVLMHTHRE